MPEMTFCCQTPSTVRVTSLLAVLVFMTLATVAHADPMWTGGQLSTSVQGDFALASAREGFTAAFRVESDSIHVATYDNGLWDAPFTPIVASLANVASFGDEVDVAVRSDGSPVVVARAYDSASQEHGVFVFRWEVDHWETEEVTRIANNLTRDRLHSLSIKIDGNDEWAVCFVRSQDDTEEILVVDSRGGGSTSQVATTAPAEVVSADFVIGPDGAYHVAYALFSEADEDEDVYYATNQSGDWTEEAVDTDEQRESGSRLGLALDAAGNPLVAYYERNGGDVWLAQKRGTWSTAVQDDEQDRGDHIAFAGNRAGDLVMSYLDNTSRELRVQTKANADATFFVETLVAGKTSAPYTDMAVSEAGMAMVLERNATDGGISYHVAVIRNDPPTLSDTTLTINIDEDVALVDSVLGVSATDPEGATLTWTISTPPSTGTASLTNATGESPSMTYTPPQDFNGEVTLTLEVSDGGEPQQVAVTIVVAPVNDPPMFTSTPVAEAEEGIDYTYSTSTADVDGDTASVRLVSGPDWLSFVDNGDGTGTLLGRPESGDAGTVSVTIEANDNNGGVTEQTFTVDVALGDVAPIATAASYSTDEDTPGDFQLAGTDANEDTLSFAVVDAPTHGTVEVNGDGVAHYVPEENYHGPDRFTFTASDGTFTSEPATADIVVNPVNDTPEADDLTVFVSPGASVTISLVGRDIDGDPLTYSVVSDPTSGAVMNLDANAGTLTYTAADVAGTDTFTYVSNDGTVDSEPATVTVDVAPNDAPVFVDPTPADDATLEAPEGEVLAFTLTAEDADGDVLTYAVEPLPEGASFDETTGEFEWTPAYPSALEVEALTLTVSDGREEDSRTVSIDFAFLDEDDDTLPDTWELENGLSPETPDTDEDGISDPDEVGSALDAPLNSDDDELIDALDGDSDNDSVSDSDEAGDDDPSTPPVDTDNDEIPDYRDQDSDGDDVLDGDDVCRLVADPEQADQDGDGQGDACEDDVDGDSVLDEADNCPRMANADQANNDDDEFGDVCDSDDDNDGVTDDVDECQFEPADTDNGCPADEPCEGDACQPDDNTAPTTPGLSAPDDGASVTAFGLTLTVSNATDAEGDQIDYLFEVFDAEDSETPIFEVTEREQPDFTEASIAAAPLELGTTYYWQARAIDEHGAESEPSARRSFTFVLPSDNCNCQTPSGKVPWPAMPIGLLVLVVAFLVRRQSSH